jgi:hypothetical protein
MLAVEQTVGGKMNNAIAGQLGADGRGARGAEIGGLKRLRAGRDRIDGVSFLTRVA